MLISGSRGWLWKKGTVHPHNGSSLVLSLAIIEDPVIANAVMDRLKHAAIQINLTGETYRALKAKKLDETALTK